MSNPEQGEEYEYMEFLVITCDHCEKPLPIIDQTTKLQLYMDADFARYSFAEIKCIEGCPTLYKFVDIDDAFNMGYLDEASVTCSEKPSDEALPWLVEQYDNYVAGRAIAEQEFTDTPDHHTETERMLETWHEFWLGYSPQPWEFTQAHD